MKNIRLFALVFAAAMTAFSMISCGKGDEPKQTPVITITSQPVAPTDLTEGSIPADTKLTVGASVTEEITLAYQWYSNTTASNEGGTAVNGATEASYTLPTDLTVGTYYYFCEVSAEGAEQKRTDLVAVSVMEDLPDDDTPPTIVSVTPNDINVPVSGNIVVTFSEAMNTEVGTIRLDSDKTLTGGLWSSGDTVFTVPYYGLNYSEQYIIHALGFKDAAYNVYHNAQIATFITVSAPVNTGYVVGNYWPNSSEPEGIVFWVKPGSNGTEGKVVGLGEAYATKWGPDNDEQAEGVTVIRSTTDGATATRNMIAKYKDSATFGTDYPAFYHIYHTVNGGDANGEWYLPARDELKMLYAGYSGKVYESITDWYSSTMPDYGSAECVVARAEFDAKLTARGGKAFGSSGNTVAWWYLSSSEIEHSNCFSLRFDMGMYSADTKSYDGNIRWVRNFTVTP